MLNDPSPAPAPRESSAPSNSAHPGSIARTPELQAHLRALKRELDQPVNSSATRTPVDPRVAANIQRISEQLYARYGDKEEIVRALYDAGHDALAERIDKCGAYAQLRRNKVTGQQKLKRIHFCGKHLFCKACWNRYRDNKLVEALDKSENCFLQDPTINASFVTFTVRAQTHLRPVYRHLCKAIDALLDRSQKYRRGYLKAWPIHDVGGIYVKEIKRASDGERWLPHIHAVILHHDEIDARELRRVWKKLTKGSHDVDVEPFEGDTMGAARGAGERMAALLQEFRRRFGYASKTSELDVPERVEAYRQLTRGGQEAAPSLLRMWGALRGDEHASPKPEKPDIEGDPEDIETIETYRQSNGVTKVYWREEPKEAATQNGKNAKKIAVRKKRVAKRRRHVRQNNAKRRK